MYQVHISIYNCNVKIYKLIKNGIQWNLSTKAMLGVKSFDPCREFGCFQSLFFIVVDHCVPFTLAVVKSQVVFRSPFVERFHCNCVCCVCVKLKRTADAKACSWSKMME